MDQALSNSMKLWAVPYRAIQDGQVIVESSDKMWSTGEGNGKPLQYSFLEKPMNSMKRQKNKDIERWTPQVSRCLTFYWKSVEKLTPEKMNRWSQSKNHTQLWMWPLMKVRSDAVKSSIAWEHRMLGPWIKANWKWSNGRWQEWTSTF